MPQYKRQELKLTVKIIRRQFPSAHMIVLFGSYARDEWVEDIYTEGHITYEYMSDFDVCVQNSVPAKNSINAGEF